MPITGISESCIFCVKQENTLHHVHFLKYDFFASLIYEIANGGTILLSINDFRINLIFYIKISIYHNSKILDIYTFKDVILFEFKKRIKSLQT